MVRLRNRARPGAKEADYMLVNFIEGLVSMEQAKEVLRLLQQLSPSLNS